MDNTLFFSERLTFHKMDILDLPLVESLFTESPAMFFYPPDKIREHAEQWIKIMQGFYKDFGLGSWLLMHKTDGIFIGQCGLNKTALCRPGMFELGFSVLKKHWNKGYASEAAQRCIIYAEENEQINTLIATVEVDNVASIRVLSKLPLTYKKMVDRWGQSVRLYQKDLNREV